MRLCIRGLCVFVACAGSVTPCRLYAQDSVSRNSDGGNGLPGDCLNPWTGGAGQRANYVVDMAPFTASWGTPLGIAPIVKSGKVNALRFSGVNGPSAISTTTRTGAAYPNPSYTLWTQPTGGVHPTENDASLNTSVTPTGTATVLSAVVLDFDESLSGATLNFTNQLIGARIAYNPLAPSRLYVTRINAAVNAPSGGGDRSQFGLGSVDADGNLVFRADGFGAAGTPANILVGDNYFRVRLPARSTVLNMIDNAGGSHSAATDWVLVRSGNLHAVPSAVPSDQAGRSIVLGADFIGNLVSETSPLNTTNTSVHRPSTTDHRGGPAYSGNVLFLGSVGTGAILTRTPGGGGRTDGISVFGVTSSGTVGTSRTFALPTLVSDSCDAFSWPVTSADFRQFDSQATFRGGSAPVAVGKDPNGNGLIAATAYTSTNNSGVNPFNAILVGRFDPSSPTSPVAWTVAAWVHTPSGDGKDILGDYGADGAPGTGDAGEGDGVVNALDAPIGRLASFTEGPTGQPGPSLSSPAFDSAGNIYFIASVALRKSVSMTIVEEFDTALVRGVLDPSTNCYRLELVLEPGMTFAGPNSGRNYRLTWLGLGDDDSIASASLWSGSVSSVPWSNADTTGLPQHSPVHLGGLVLSARIVYDADNNGVFSDPTSPGGSPGSVDEAYNVMLYVGNRLAPGPLCDAIDFNNDGLFPDTLDVDDFLSVFAGGSCSNDPNCNDIDFNNDGLFPDTLDVDSYLSVFSGGPCL